MHHVLVHIVVRDIRLAGGHQGAEESGVSLYPVLFSGAIGGATGSGDSPWMFRLDDR